MDQTRKEVWGRVLEGMDDRAKSKKHKVGVMRFDIFFVVHIYSGFSFHLFSSPSLTFISFHFISSTTIFTTPH